MLSAVTIWVAALWWGSLTAVGLYVVPLLFVYLPTPALAGNMAAKLFSAQSWVALGCGTLLLMNSRQKRPLAQPNYGFDTILVVVFGMMLAMLSEFAISPRIVARENLKLWHGVGVGLLALQWVCAALVFRKMLTIKTTAAPA